MAFLDNILNQLFPDREDKRKVQVLEELRRSENYLAAYQSWKESPEAEELVKAVERSYYLKKNQIQGNYAVHLFQSPAANGFALTHHPSLSPRTFQFLLDFWRDRVLALGYRLANTDRQIREKEQFVETIEKHYLKPPLSKNTAQAEQRFGNVLLEYVLVDQQPSYLKVMVTIYSDRLFTEAQPFDDLLEHLFSLK